MFEIGNSLREARLRQGFDLVEAEAATKIRSKYLRALEEERFEVLPAQTYVKGFLRSYADHLGLDGQLYVDEFNSRYVTGELEDAPAIRTQRSTARARAHRKAESRVLVVALAGIATATALVVVAWKWGGQEPRTIPNLGEGPATSGQVEQRPQAQAPAAPPAYAVQLKLTALRGNSWIAVHRNTASGELLFAGTLERGRSMTFSGNRLWLNIGTPENVQARINGDRSLIPGGKGAAPVVIEATKRGFRALSS